MLLAIIPALWVEKVAEYMVENEYSSGSVTFVKVLFVIAMLCIMLYGAYNIRCPNCNANVAGRYGRICPECGNSY